MNRLDAMLERLPPIYNIEPGSLLHRFMALIAGALAAFDEDMDRVRRSHWVDTAFDRRDLERIGALFDVAAAPWEPDHLYRERLKATIAARLRGAVTRDVLELVLVRILAGAQEALGSRYFQLPARAGAGAPAFATGAGGDPGLPAFVEFPRRRRRSPELVAARGLVKPLGRLILNNRGLHPAALEGVVRGVAPRRTAVPVLVNLTNGGVLAFVGDLPCGRELRLGVAGDGTLAAEAGGRDVRDRVFTGGDFVAGAPFEPVVPHPDPLPLRLERGANEIWFFPLALFDENVLSTGVFGMPAADVEHGRFAEAGRPEAGTAFDRSLFEQPPAVSLDLFWDEVTAASFRFEIPAGVVRRRLDRGGDREADRSRLFAMLQQTVELLRAAAVDGRVEPRPLGDVQRQSDRVRVFDPTRAREEMRVESRLSGLSALFDVSAIDGSRFD